MFKKNLLGLLLAVAPLCQAAVDVTVNVGGSSYNYVLSLDAAEYPKRTVQQFGGVEFCFEITQVVSKEEGVEISAEVRVTAEDEEVVIAAPVVEAPWDEEAVLRFVDESGESVEFVFKATKD